ncbi:MAG: DUF1343 domain-containing protein [Akkermansiaceae bacterium]|nr:DUF1343 domain-containing protein [Armatimonadota bacterium]
MPAVLPGIAALASQGFSLLRGLRIGLVTNPTGILPDGKTSNVDALFRADGVKLVALFGPEHGVRGDVPAGKYIASYRDKRTGLPVYSLYGKTKYPTAAMLQGIDVLLFDLQDTGCRSYTYLSTLGAVLESGARYGIPVVVCDRPNPLGGVRVEGRPVEPGYVSFVSRYPVAYRHGMTLGEVAKLLVGRGYVRKADLRVIPCEDLSRVQAGWETFGGSPWVPTSPNIPTPDAAILNAATGIVGELPALSVGIGTANPFGYCGSPKVNAERFADVLNNYGLAGIAFQPAQWVPAKGAFRGKTCAGVRVRIADMATAELCRVNFALLCALRSAAPTVRPFARIGLFDEVCGTDSVRKVFLAGATQPEVWAEFQRGAAMFAESRKRYLIY